MNQYDSVTDLATLEAPWNKHLTFQEVTYQGGLKLLRLRIREGKRFTDLELDPATAGRVAGLLGDWAGKVPTVGR
jgi:hypothetical protein